MTTATPASVSVVVVSYNTKAHLQRCLQALRLHPPRLSFEIVVIDNASLDGSPELVGRDFPEVRLLRSKTNDGYGTAVNRAVLGTSGEYLLLLNPDAEVLPGALRRPRGLRARSSGRGVIGPRLLLSDGRPQPSARRFPSASMLLGEALRLHKLLPAHWRSRLLLGTYFEQNVTREVPWVSGACHLIPRVVWDHVGALTEETFCGFDDLDYCFRVRRAGYSVWLCTDATIRHHCSVAVRGRWSPWEVEQVAIHNAYVVLSALWPKWKVKAYCAAEATAWLLECLRELVLGRRLEFALPEASTSRLRRRLRLTLRFLFGLETRGAVFSQIHPARPSRRGICAVGTVRSNSTNQFVAQSSYC